MHDNGITVRAARWSATHPWQAVLGWLVFVALCVGAGAATGTRQVQGEDFWVGEAGRAEAIATEAGLARQNVEKVLITGPDRAEARVAAGELARRADALEAVTAVGESRPSGDGAALVLPITLIDDDKAAREQVESVLDATAAVQAAHPALRIAQTGEHSTGSGVESLIGHDLARAEQLTLPVTLLILVVVFGALVAAGVPVVLALTSIAAAMGLYAVSTVVIPSPGGAVQNVILMIGMAVGVDYSLFYLKRVREERAGGRMVHDVAVEYAAATAGRAIVVSGVAVLVPLVALYLADDVIFTGIATGSIIVVAVAMASSLTVLPAMLVLLGRWLDWPRIPGLSRSGRGRLWPALLRPALRRPALTLAAATCAMLLLALPALTLKISAEGIDTHPRSVPAVDTWHRMTEIFPAEGVSHMVAVRTQQAGQARAALTDLAHRAHGPLFAETAAPAIRTSADGRTGTLELPIPHGGATDEARASLALLREVFVPQVLGGVAGAEYAVSGDVARSVDPVEHQAGKIPWVVAFALVLTFAMVVVAFRSVVIGGIVVVLNLLSAAAAFGALVLVFQHTWAEGLLGFTSTGFIGSRIPLILFVILFGLSMDYQVFVLSRIREAVQRGLPTRDAVARGITGSAGVVTSAAVVMVSVFAAFTFAGMLELKQTGFGLAVAVLLDALVVRILVLPAALTLLGRFSWWPSRAIFASDEPPTRRAPALR